MPTLCYKARSTEGRVVRGRVEAASPQEAIRRLRREGIQVISMQEPGRVGAAVTGWFGRERKKRVKTKELLASLSQLRLMIDSGTGLDDALKILCETARSERFRDVLNDVRGRVKRGEPLSQALHAHPDVFGTILARMVGAGEASGTMSVMLETAHEMMERQDDLRRTIRSALAYPAVLLTVAVAALCVLFIWVLPKFAQVFSEVGAELPGITVSLLAVSDFVVTHKLLLAVVALVIGVGVRGLWSMPNARAAWTRWLLRWPVIGNLIKASYTARSMQIMGTLWRSGLPITEVTRLTSATLRNPLYRDFFENLRQRLIDGKRITASFSASDLFPATVAPLIRTGEETGTTPDVLLSLARYHEKETRGLIKTMITMLEPAIIVLMAMGVGLIAISVVVPLFRLSSAVH